MASASPASRGRPRPFPLRPPPSWGSAGQHLQVSPHLGFHQPVCSGAGAFLPPSGPLEVHLRRPTPDPAHSPHLETCHLAAKPPLAVRGDGHTWLWKESQLEISVGHLGLFKRLRRWFSRGKARQNRPENRWRPMSGPPARRLRMAPESLNFYQVSRAAAAGLEEASPKNEATTWRQKAPCGAGGGRSSVGPLGSASAMLVREGHRMVPPVSSLVKRPVCPDALQRLHSPSPRRCLTSGND